VAKVYILEITHRHGRNIEGAYEDRRDAEQALYDYVVGEWDDEVVRRGRYVEYGGGVSEWLAKEDVIKNYFDDIVDDEFWEIIELPVIQSRYVEPAIPLTPSDHEAVFHPQSWMNDYAVEVDPEGEQMWRISQGYLDQVRVTHPDNFADLYSSSLVSDAVKNDPAAPEWVRNWQGPSWVEVYKVDGN
jgi:hypothetical protein